MSFVWVRASLTVWAAPFNEDPLRLLLLFAWLFAVWDGLIAHRKSTLDFCLWTYIVINYTHKFWLLHSPAGFYQCVVEWVAREEMKRRIALKGAPADSHAYRGACGLTDTAQIAWTACVLARPRRHESCAGSGSSRPFSRQGCSHPSRRARNSHKKLRAYGARPRAIEG